jgi:hypothetical protein
MGSPPTENGNGAFQPLFSFSFAGGGLPKASHRDRQVKNPNPKKESRVGQGEAFPEEGQPGRKSKNGCFHSRRKIAKQLNANSLPPTLDTASNR